MLVNLVTSVISSGDLRCCLLSQCEDLRVYRLGSVIATTYCDITYSAHTLINTTMLSLVEFKNKFKRYCWQPFRRTCIYYNNIFAYERVEGKQ